MEANNKLHLSEHAQRLLAIQQDKHVAHAQKRLNELRAMSVVEFLAKGITISDAPFELIGRLVSRGWESITYDVKNQTWQAWTTGYRSLQNLTVEQVQDMLEAEE